MRILDMKDNLPELATGDGIHRNNDKQQYLKELDWEDYLEYLDRKENE